MIIRTNDIINGIVEIEEYYIAYGNNMTYFYNKVGKLLNQVYFEVAIQDIKQNERYLAFISKRNVYMLEKIHLIKLTENLIISKSLDLFSVLDKENLDQVVLTNKMLYVIKSDSIVKYTLLSFESFITKYSQKNLCIGSVKLKDSYFIGLEDGQIKCLDYEKSVIICKKNMTCFDRSEEFTIVGTFCKKILIFDSKENLINEIVINSHPIKMKLWNEFVCVLDSENNLNLFNMDLQLYHSRNYNGLLHTFDIIGRDISLIYTTGTIFKSNSLPQLIK